MRMRHGMPEIKMKQVEPNNYSGSEGARVKVSALFFVFIFGVPNFLRGYKA